jgi:ATP-dependent helicase IRC3
VLWVTHRVELLRQGFLTVANQVNKDDMSIFAVMEPRWLDGFSLPLDELERDANKARVVFTTTHSIEQLRHDNWTLVVIDEAHNYHTESVRARTLTKAMQRAQQGVRLGLTGTPRESEPRFTKLWDVEHTFDGRGVVEGGVTGEWLAQEGYRARPDPSSTSWATGFVFTVNTSTPSRRDFEIESNVGAFNNHKVNTAVKQAYERFRTESRRTLLFAVTIDHAEECARRIGNAAKTIHSGLTFSQQNDALNWFREETNESRVLCSVLMLTEGVDLPKVDTLFLVRPTFSPILHDQMLGRGYRGSRFGGTETCRFVDFTYSFVDAGGAPVSGQVIIDSVGSVVEDEEEESEAHYADKVEKRILKSLNHAGYRLRDQLEKLETEGLLDLNRLRRKYGIAESTFASYLSRNENVPDKFFDFVKEELTALGLYAGR